MVGVFEVIYKQLTLWLHIFKEINNINEKIYILATTNMPWELDVAVLRRFERRVLLPLPKKESRLEIFKSFTGKLRLTNIGSVRRKSYLFRLKEPCT